MDALLACLPCLKSTRNSPQAPRLSEKPLLTHHYTLLSETMTSQSFPPIEPADKETAAQILLALQTAQKPGPELSASIQDIVHAQGGWTEAIARAVLASVEVCLKTAEPLSPVMASAYERVKSEVAKIGDFAKDHPAYTEVLVTVVALGILVLVLPWVLEALGFGALGPIEGKWLIS